MSQPNPRLILVSAALLALGACATSETRSGLIADAGRDQMNPFVHVRQDPSQKLTSGNFVTELPEAGSGALVVETGDGGTALSRDLFGAPD